MDPNRPYSPGIPRNPLTFWEHLPFSAKLPVPRYTDERKPVYRTTKIGHTLWRPTDGLDFDRWDPLLHRVPAPKFYNQLNDHSLQMYLCIPARQEKFCFHGLASGEGEVICTLKDLNQFRSYLSDVNIKHLKRIQETDHVPNCLDYENLLKDSLKTEMTEKNCGLYQLPRRQYSAILRKRETEELPSIRHSQMSSLPPEQILEKQAEDRQLSSVHWRHMLNREDRKKRYRKYLEHDARKEAVRRCRIQQEQDDRQRKAWENWTNRARGQQMLIEQREAKASSDREIMRKNLKRRAERDRQRFDKHEGELLDKLDGWRDGKEQKQRDIEKSSAIRMLKNEMKSKKSIRAVEVMVYGKEHLESDELFDELKESSSDHSLKAVALARNISVIPSYIAIDIRADKSSSSSSISQDIQKIMSGGDVDPGPWALFLNDEKDATQGSCSDESGSQTNPENQDETGAELDQDINRESSTEEDPCLIDYRHTHEELSSVGCQTAFYRIPEKILADIQNKTFSETSSYASYYTDVTEMEEIVLGITYNEQLKATVGTLEPSAPIISTESERLRNGLATSVERILETIYANPNITLSQLKPIYLKAQGIAKRCEILARSNPKRVASPVVDSLLDNVGRELLACDEEFQTRENDPTEWKNVPDVEDYETLELKSFSREVLTLTKYIVQNAVGIAAECSKRNQDRVKTEGKSARQNSKTNKKQTERIPVRKVDRKSGEENEPTRLSSAAEKRRLRKRDQENKTSNNSKKVSTSNRQANKSPNKGDTKDEGRNKNFNRKKYSEGEAQFSNTNKNSRKKSSTAKKAYGGGVGSLSNKEKEELKKKCFFKSVERSTSDTDVFSDGDQESLQDKINREISVRIDRILSVPSRLVAFINRTLKDVMESNFREPELKWDKLVPLRTNSATQIGQLVLDTIHKARLEVRFTKATPCIPRHNRFLITASSLSKAIDILSYHQFLYDMHDNLLNASEMIDMAVHLLQEVLALRYAPADESAAAQKAATSASIAMDVRRTHLAHVLVVRLLICALEVIHEAQTLGLATDEDIINMAINASVENYAAEIKRQATGRGFRMMGLDLNSLSRELVETIRRKVGDYVRVVNEGGSPDEDDCSVGGVDLEKNASLGKIKMTKKEEQTVRNAVAEKVEKFVYRALKEYVTRIRDSAEAKEDRQPAVDDIMTIVDELLGDLDLQDIRKIESSHIGLHVKNSVEMSLERLDRIHRSKQSNINAGPIDNDEESKIQRRLSEKGKAVRVKVSAKSIHEKEDAEENNNFSQDQAGSDQGALDPVKSAVEPIFENKVLSIEPEVVQEELAVISLKEDKDLSEFRSFSAAKRNSFRNVHRPDVSNLNRFSKGSQESSDISDHVLGVYQSHRASLDNVQRSSHHGLGDQEGGWRTSSMRNPAIETIREDETEEVVLSEINYESLEKDNLNDIDPQNPLSPLDSKKQQNNEDPDDEMNEEEEELLNDHLTVEIDRAYDYPYDEWASMSTLAEKFGESMKLYEKDDEDLQQDQHRMSISLGPERIERTSQSASDSLNTQADSDHSLVDIEIDEDFNLLGDTMFDDDGNGFIIDDEQGDLRDDLDPGTEIDVVLHEGTNASADQQNKENIRHSATGDVHLDHNEGNEHVGIFPDINSKPPIDEQGSVSTHYDEKDSSQYDIENEPFDDEPNDDSDDIRRDEDDDDIDLPYDDTHDIQKTHEDDDIIPQDEDNQLTDEDNVVNVQDENNNANNSFSGIIVVHHLPNENSENPSRDSCSLDNNEAHGLLELKYKPSNSSESYTKVQHKQLPKNENNNAKMDNRGSKTDKISGILLKNARASQVKPVEVEKPHKPKILCPGGRHHKSNVGASNPLAKHSDKIPMEAAGTLSSLKSDRLDTETKSSFGKQNPSMRKMIRASGSILPSKPTIPSRVTSSSSSLDSTTRSDAPKDRPTPESRKKSGGISKK